MNRQTSGCGEDIILLLSKMIRAYFGFRYHRIRRTNNVVGTGSAVSPRYLLLVFAGSWQDRSDDHVTLNGLKLFRLSSGLVQRPCLLWSFIVQEIPPRSLPRVLTCSEGRSNDRVDTEMSSI